MLSNIHEKLQEILIKSSVCIVRDYEEIQYLQRINSARREDFGKASIKKSTSLILEKLSESYPGVNLEVDGIPVKDSPKANKTINIESMNGRKNFLRGIKDFTVCMALMENHSKNFEIVYSPIHKMTYWAKKEEGAYSVDEFIKKRRLRASNSSIKDESIIGTDTEPGKVSVPNVRNIGCSTLALCYVAAGNWDAAIIARQGKHPMGSLILEEAKGTIYHKDAFTIGSNGNILSPGEMIEN